MCEAPQAEVYVDKEFVFQSLGDMKTIIPYSDKWSTLLVQVSGGLDSALLLFLTAKVLKDNNSQVEILPLSFDVPYKAKNLSSARAVIQKIRELTQYEHISPGIEVAIPFDKCENPEKNAFIGLTVAELIKARGVSFEFNGNTKNPPAEVRQRFSDDLDRELGRDRRSTIYNSPTSASPHAFNDKSGIVALYVSENILDEIAPLTLSCDMNIDVILDRKLPIPCKECWWCHERKWGFAVNGVPDHAKIIFGPP